MKLWMSLLSEFDACSAVDTNFSPMIHFVSCSCTGLGDRQVKGQSYDIPVSVSFIRSHVNSFSQYFWIRHHCLYLTRTDVDGLAAAAYSLSALVVPWVLGCTCASAMLGLSCRLSSRWRNLELMVPILDNAKLTLHVPLCVLDFMSRLLRWMVVITCTRG